MAERHQVVILGGGFGGLHAARALRGAPVRGTLVDRRNFHLFQPLLYQVATGGLSPANIAAPLRNILKRQANFRVLLGEACDLDAASRQVVLHDGQVLAYDTLVAATGSTHHYFGKSEWAALAPGLKTVEDATEIRGRLFLAFERAEREPDPRRRAALLTFVIVGAGPTGVELAGALAEIARDTLAHEFRSIDPADARILILEAADRVLPAYAPHLSAKAALALGRLGIQVRTQTLVTDIGPEAVVAQGKEAPAVIPTATVVWAAGVQASPFGAVLARRAGAALDRAGRVMVQPELSLPGHPEILVVGDLAHLPGPDGRPLPGVAQVAMQQGAYAARLIAARLRGERLPAFRYRDYGTMATIGRHAAVADLFGLRFSGRLAWLAWLFIHLMQLVQFENRLLVLVQWAWNYFSYNRAARLITGYQPACREPEARG
ncbi:MAG: NAD(P)/FAD-dependent oxidoreductase [Candidatus Methylomirabilales bacterium]